MDQSTTRNRKDPRTEHSRQGLTPAKPSHSLDDLGRSTGLVQSFSNGSGSWQDGGVPNAYNVEYRRRVDGQVDSITRGEGTTFAADRFFSELGYRGDGLLEEITHSAGTDGSGPDVALHRLGRALDGRIQTGSTILRDTEAVPVGTAGATYGFDPSTGNVTSITLTSGTNIDLLPGFQPLDASGQNVVDGGERLAHNRLSQVVEPGTSQSASLDYDVEGRVQETTRFVPQPGQTALSDEFAHRFQHDASGRTLVETYLSGLSATSLSIDSQSEFAYDAAGRLIAVRYDADGTGGTAPVTTGYFNGGGNVPELVWTLGSDFTPAVRFHVGMDSSGRTLAIVGDTGDSSGPVWTLNDTGGSIRSYATTSGGTLNAVEHVNFDGRGLQLPGVSDVPSQLAFPDDLPVVFSGYHALPGEITYRTDQGLYDPSLGIAVVPSADETLIDQYTVSTNYPMTQAPEVDMGPASGSLLTRGLGAVRAGFGAVGAFVGSGLSLTGFGAIVGVPLAAWSLDQYYTGIVEAGSGISQQSVGAGLIQRGLGDGTAGQVASFAYDVLPGFVTLNPAGAIRVGLAAVPRGAVAFSTLRGAYRVASFPTRTAAAVATGTLAATTRSIQVSGQLAGRTAAAAGSTGRAIVGGARNLNQAARAALSRLTVAPGGVGNLSWRQFRSINAGRFSRTDLSSAWLQYKNGVRGNYLTREPSRIERFFFDNRNFDAVRKSRGGAQGLTFEHAFIMQRSFDNSVPSVLRGLGNSGWNSGLLIGRSLNSSLGNNFAKRLGFRAYVVGSSAGAGYSGYWIGDEYVAPTIFGGDN